MSDEVIKLKGGSAGLQLILDPTAEFDVVVEEIKKKLQEGSNFFCKGTTIWVVSDKLSREEKDRLVLLFSKHGVIMRTGVQEYPAPQAKQPAAVPEPVRGAEIQEMMVVNRTIRGGEEITSPSSVLVCGNVNPGAQIIAGGSIDIRGTCRGIVHAGANGDKSAFIIADHLMPVQIRIADMIARSPDNMEKTAHAEKAYIKNGQITIEPIDR